jgi:hypothetical protein
LDAVIASAFIVVIACMLIVVMLVGAWIAGMARVLESLEANYGAPRYAGVPTSRGGPRLIWPGRAVHRERDPAWWARFERQFAEYVERIG